MDSSHNEPHRSVSFGKVGTPPIKKGELGVVGTSTGAVPHCPQCGSKKTSKAGRTYGKLVYVRYSDHVVFSRSQSLAMKPQTREAIGWLVYECEQYVTLTWDRDAEPPTLKGGDPKASGLVVLRTDILEMEQIA